MAQEGSYQQVEHLTKLAVVRNAGDSCSGYELVANISLAAYADADGGKGWQPLGHDTNDINQGCDGTAFNGAFEGNGWTISGLNINRPDEDCVGLFGHIAANSEIRNLTLSAEAVIGRSSVGGLVGAGASARIHSSSVVVGEVNGIGDWIGGLVGWGAFARIHSSSVVAGKVKWDGSSGTGDNVGGLVGWGVSAQIHFSSAVVGEVSGRVRVGGLVGNGQLAQIHSSSVVVGEVSGTGDNALGHGSSVGGSGGGWYIDSDLFFFGCGG